MTTPGTGLGAEGPSGIEPSIPAGRTRAVQGAIQPVITFDAGQTLVELDLDFLAARLRARGVEVEPAALVGAAPAAWRHYDAIVDAGASHRDAWLGLVTGLLAGAGVAEPAPHAAWLYRENPGANLWRAPIAGMLALARELATRGLRVGVLSNSEGRLAELLAEIGVAGIFAAIVDSGRVGLEKPDRRIFDHALAVLGGGDGIHIGDSWDADIAGARRAGWRAIWYGRHVTAVDDPGVAVARDAGAARAALVRWGVLPDP